MELRNLEVNNKLISLGGVIGKRDYIYNILMAYVISGVLTAPMYITFLKSPYTFFENIDKIRHYFIKRYVFRHGIFCYKNREFATIER